MASEGKKVAGRPPYGFIEDPGDKHNFLIDDYAAGVVRQMYEMRAREMSYGKIAKFLNNEGVLSPREYAYHRIGKENPYKTRSVWMVKTVRDVLSSEAYIGNRVQLRQGTMSYRLQKIVQRPPEEWVRCENAHPSIVDKNIWHRVQEINVSARETFGHKPLKKSLFQGKLRCANCGGKFVYVEGKRKLKSGKISAYPIYQCARYTQSGRSNCSAHTVKENALKDIIADELLVLSKKMKINKNKVAADLRKRLAKKPSGGSKTAPKTLKLIDCELAGLEQKIAKLYEDKVSGVVTEQTFSMLLRDFQTEQNRLDTERLKMQEVQTVNQSAENDISAWMTLIEKYYSNPEIDRELLDELVDRIEIGEQKTVDGQRTQEIKVFYRFVGLMTK